MAAGDKVQGDVLLLHIWDGLAYRPIACVTSNDLSSTAEIIETQNKCNPGKIGVEYGNVNKSISIDGEFIDTTSAGGDPTKASFDYLENLQDTKTKAAIKIDGGLEDASSKYAIAVIEDLTLTGPAGEIATFSATLNIDGGYIPDPNN